MEKHILETYLKKAEKAIEENEFLEALKILEEALTIDPKFGKAHSHLGWLYLYKIVDWGKAEIHLEMALQYSPEYSAAYIHMSHLLFEKRNFGKLAELLSKAGMIDSINKSFVFNEFGRMYEVSGNYGTAISYYKQAIRWSLDEQDLNHYKESIKRCREKRWILAF
jgi:tetratricopeptide (TPR) repeat protein